MFFSRKDNSLYFFKEKETITRKHLVSLDEFVFQHYEPPPLKEAAAFIAPNCRR